MSSSVLDLLRRAWYITSALRKICRRLNHRIRRPRPDSAASSLRSESSACFGRGISTDSGSLAHCSSAWKPTGWCSALAAAARRVPAGVVCLLSALRLHDLTTQAPFEVWMAIDHKARRPSVADLPLRIVRFSGQALATGIQERRVGGVIVRFYSAAKTVADCFKFRNKIGLDVALEALREYLRHRKGTVDDLWRSAKICRVENVIRPYLEALVGQGR